MTVVVTLFGPMQLTVDGVSVSPGGATTCALLAFLALEADRAHARESVAALFWPDHAQSAAFTNLRQVLTRARQALSDPIFATIIEVTRHTLRFKPGADVVDVGQFSGLIDQCEAHPHRDIAACPACLAKMEEAVTLYRGELLQGLSFECSQGWDEWLFFRREVLQRQMLETLDTLTRASEMVTNYEAMRRYAHHQVALEPWREEAHTQLMRALAYSGQRAAALAQYETCRQMLMTAFGVEPDAETLALREEIGAGALVPTKRIATPAHNLPATLTPFIGREAELTMIAARLSRPNVRLLTIVGAGGMGKTRLAVEAARAEVSAYPDGVFFIALAPLAHVSMIPDAIASVVGLTVYGDPTAALLHFLRDRQVLLVLDNFEHLVDGAGMIVALLEAAPRVRVLVTSRTRLAVRGEELFQIEGLAFVHSGTMSKNAPSPAVRLFVQSARRIVPHFTLDADNLAAVMHICRLVEGMPLGLELAAAWVETLRLSEIADEIERHADILMVEWRDAPERQRSIRAVFMWSWRLLSDEQRRVFSHVAIFRGGFTRTAAEVVAGASLPTLGDLVHASLLRPGGAGSNAGVRYDIHMLLRQYAELELHRDAGEREAVEARHGTFYLAYVAERERRLARSEPREAASEIRIEIDNVRQAWAWAARVGDIAALDRSAVALWQFFWTTGLSSDGDAVFGLAARQVEARLHDADAGKTSGPATRLLSKLLALQGFMLVHLSRYDLAKSVADRAIEVGETCEGVEGMTIAHFVRGEALYRLGQRLESRAAMQRAVDLAHQFGARFPASEALCDIEWHAHVWWRGIELSLGDYDAAWEHGKEALNLCHALGKRLGEVHCLCNLADIAREVRDLPAARRDYEHALRLAPGVGYRWGEGVIQAELGDVVRLQGDYGRSLALSERALAVFKEIGEYVEETRTKWQLGRLYMYVGDYEAARHWLDQFQRAIVRIEAPEVRVEGLLVLSLLAHYLHDAEESLAYAQEAWMLANNYSSRYTQAHARVILGHAYADHGQWTEATAAYQQACARYEELGNPALTAEPQAGLARVASAQGDDGQALRHIETILRVLADHVYVGLDEPFDIYLTCYRVLERAGDPRADGVLRAAHTALEAYMRCITDERLRDSFLENVVVHRELHHAIRYPHGAMPIEPGVSAHATLRT